MKNWASTENIQGVDFPNYYARDETSPGAKDGTRLRAEWVSDIMGFLQACIDGVALTPSGAAEIATASQILQGIQGHCGAPGELAWWAGPTIPSTVRLLPLEGQTIIYADYPALVANVWCGSSDNATAASFYRCTDAGGLTRSIVGTHLKLPDARGRFLRCIDVVGGIDPEGDRWQGSLQDAGLAQHTHAKLYVSSTEYKLVSTPLAAGALGILGIGLTGASMSTGNTGTGIGTGSTNENRPANIAARLCIRY